MRAVVCIPTYNEIDSLPVTLAALREAVPAADVLVIDDASPDGTGSWADARAAVDPAVHVLHRTGKEGLGPAYRAGFAWALERGYDVVCEMDADGSHPPDRLPQLLEAVAGGADLAIGSRWVPGGRVANWPLSRQLISRAGNLYTRLALGIGVRDATAGYRAFRRRALEAVPLAEVASSGYCFQIDMTWRVLRAGGRVVEVPITFVEREAGVSKMSRDIVVEALTRVTVWGVRDRLARLRAVARRVSGREPGDREVRPTS
ncbi:MAG: polyprenol monophosphomannose synthase [Kineosporiaceae bacterium]